MSTHLIQQLANSIGVFITMIGALLIAFEVTNQYKGAKFKPGVGVNTTSGFGEPVVSSSPPKETEEYNRWEIKKYLFLTSGLLAIMVGGLLQIIASWICY